MEIDREEVHALRAKIRAVLPPRDDSLVRDEVLSACMAAFVEVAVIRLVQEAQDLRKAQMSAEEAQVIMSKLERALADAFSGVALEYVPDATVWHSFRPPEDTE